MALPIMKTPLYNIIIPSTKKEVKFRPFLVKEEKALLLAQQSEDPKVMVNTLKDIIAGCISEDIDVNSLAIFDFEYLFTHIRSKSVGEFVELLFLCDTCDDEKAKAPVSMDISKFEVVIPEDHKNKIDLADGIGVVMKYPSVNSLEKLESAGAGDVDSMFDVVSECIDYIYTNEEVFYVKDQSKAEVMEFLESLTQEQFSKIEAFFEAMPKMSQKVEYNCPVCNKHHEKLLEGLQSFF